MKNPDYLFTSLAQAEQVLDRLAAHGAPVSGQPWNWAQTLAHCAQSIEYSMTGFPQAKPAWFQRTLGATALRMFLRRGRMRHGLDAPIPGAPPVPADIDPAAAHLHLRHAIHAFLRWEGPLKPHFAYGALDRPTYEKAHAMHLAEHLSAFRS